MTKFIILKTPGVGENNFNLIKSSHKEPTDGIPFIGKILKTLRMGKIEIVSCSATLFNILPEVLTSQCNKLRKERKRQREKEKTQRSQRNSIRE